ncbi:MULTISPECIES: hypothetical protein, partial [unclassified Mesorhizobium]|uniref:hypothetical protein n=1 Tax=unclassified Mesorhizobium TaxID=325217 RepID=UPI001AEDAE20
LTSRITSTAPKCFDTPESVIPVMLAILLSYIISDKYPMSRNVGLRHNGRSVVRRDAHRAKRDRGNNGRAARGRARRSTGVGTTGRLFNDLHFR